MPLAGLISFERAEARSKAEPRVTLSWITEGEGVVHDSWERDQDGDECDQANCIAVELSDSICAIHVGPLNPMTMMATPHTAMISTMNALPTTLATSLKANTIR
jgi:hypothetical protein